MNEGNWVKVNPTVTETDKRALERAHKYERKLVRDNWRWYRLNTRMKVLVPFGKDGKPTTEGMRIIKRYLDL